MFPKFSIPKRSSTCNRCKTTLKSGVEYISLLEKESEIYLRKDFCTTCDHSSSQKAIFWKAKIPQKILFSPDLDHAYNELQELLQNLDEPLAPQKAFLLALYLERKRCLTFRSETPEGILIYENVQEGEILTLPKVDPKTLDSESLKKELSYLK